MADSDYIIRIRGLPWTVSKQNIVDFFNGCKIRGGHKGVFICVYGSGRSTGVAFVVMESEQDLNRALKNNLKSIGPRYIEVFQASKSEYITAIGKFSDDIKKDVDVVSNEVVARDESVNLSEANVVYLKLRGIPWGCSKHDIQNFFAGVNVSLDSVIFAKDYYGKLTGDAYIQVESEREAKRALDKDREKIGHRYIEIFRSSQHEYEAVKLDSSQLRSSGDRNISSSLSGGHASTANQIREMHTMVAPNAYRFSRTSVSRNYCFFRAFTRALRLKF